MNIWLINHYAVPTRFYPLARPATFAKHLMKAGHGVTIFAASAVHNSDINLISNKSKYKEEIVDGIHYVYVRASQYKGNGKKRIVNMLQYPLRLGSVCKHFEKPDVIIATSVTPMACYAGLKLAKKYKCMGIAEIADLWPETFVAYGLINAKNPILKSMYWYEKRIYKLADKIIFTMEGGRDYIIDKGWDNEHGGPIDLNKVNHINNGVDLEEYDYNKKHYVTVDEDLDNNQTFKVIYAGAIRRTNQIETIINSAKYIKEKNNDKIKFIIYGDGNERIYLEDKCKNEGITNVVFKGKVDKKYIPYILSKANLNILTYSKNDILKYGGSQNKNFEYLASGRPVLSTNTMGYDIINKYNTGISLSDQSPESIAEAITSIASLPSDDYLQLSNNARIAAQDYDFQLLTNKLIGIIEK